MSQNLFTLTFQEDEQKKVIEDLDEKKLPSLLQNLFQNKGYPLKKNTKVAVKIPGRSWLLMEEGRHYLVDYLPRKEQFFIYGIAGKPAMGAILENIEALLVALIFALIIRHFTLEAFVIPTGSMAPALLGIHAQVKCPNCGYPFAIGNPGFDPVQSSRSIDLVCPNCQLGKLESRFQIDLSRTKLRGGDKILVNKFIYLLQKPKRWDVIVFLSPQKHHKNFIKRLVGLPGETLQIFHGDIFLKNKKTGKMEILRKPDHVQENLWMNVYDSRYEEEKKTRYIWETPKEEEDKKIQGKTLACTECGKVIFLDQRFQISHGKIKGDFQKGEGRLKFHRSIHDIYGYNRALRGGNLVGDIRCTFDGQFSKQGVFTIDISRPLKRFVVKIDYFQKKITLFSGTWKFKKIQEKEFPCSCQGTELHHYDIAHVDGQIWLKLDGKIIFRYTYDSPATAEDEDAERFWLKFGFKKTKVFLQNIHIFRDIHYTDSPSNYGVNEPITLKKDELFALGDNSPNSQDSRDWGPVPIKNLLGRAFIVFWPAIPFWDWQVRWIR